MTKKFQQQTQLVFCYGVLPYSFNANRYNKNAINLELLYVLLHNSKHNMDLHLQKIIQPLKIKLLTLFFYF